MSAPHEPGRDAGVRGAAAPRDGERTTPSHGSPAPLVRRGASSSADVFADPRLFRASALVGAARASASRPTAAASAGSPGTAAADPARPGTGTGAEAAGAGAGAEAGAAAEGTPPDRANAARAAGDWPPRGCVVELAGGLDGACTSFAVAAVAATQRAGELAVWVQPRHGLLFPPDLAAHGVDLDELVVVHVPPSGTAPLRSAAPARPDQEASATAASPSASLAAATAAARATAPAADDAASFAAVSSVAVAPGSLSTGSARSGPAHARTPGRRRVGFELPEAAELLLRAGAFDLLVLDLRPEPPPFGAWLHRLQALARKHQTRVLLLADVRAPSQPASAVSQRLEAKRRRAAPGFTVEPRLLADKLHAPAPPPFGCSAPAGCS